MSGSTASGPGGTAPGAGGTASGAGGTATGAGGTASGAGGAASVGFSGGSPEVRLLHASDVHVEDGDGGQRGLSQLLDVALAAAVDVVLLVGDTFDHGRVRPDTLAEFAAHLDRVRMPVLVLPGNHDPVMEGNPYDRVELPPHVHVLRDGGGEVVELAHLGLEVWGRPHTSFADSRPLADLPPRGRQPWQVALAHGHLVRHPEDRHRSYLITSDEIAASDRDYIALGHWDVAHDASAGGVTAWYSGSPTRFARCALVTLGADDDGRRAVRVEPVTLPGR